MPLDYAISALVTLLVVVDPVGLAPTFIGITEGMPRRFAVGRAAGGGDRRRDPDRQCSDRRLAFARLAISLSAFRIAGGLLLFSIATEMVFGVRMRREGEAAEQAIEERARNIAAFPLAIPLMAGPGAITATVLLAGRANGNLLLLGVLLAVVLAVAACCFAAFLLAVRIGRLLGVTGNIVLSRLLGVLLAALAVQYVVDGIRAILAG